MRTLILLYFILLSSCSKMDPFVGMSSAVCSEFPKGVPVLTDKKLFNDHHSDGFILDTVYIDRNVLHISISYGGGCERVRMALLSDGETMGLSLPPYVPLKIMFEDNDPCEALIREEFCFDLASIQYVSTLQEVLIHLPEWGEKIPWKIR